MKNRIHPLTLCAFAALALMICIEPAFAQLPWEGPLQKLQTSLTGPVAKAIGIIAMAVSGAMLAFGGEMSEFAKRICMVVLALAVLLTASTFIGSLGLPN